MKSCRLIVCVALAWAVSVAGARQPGQIRVELQYPTKVTEMILVGVEEGELVFRPPGDDFGGRAYLSIAELERQRAVVNALYPPAFGDALRDLGSGRSEAALPALSSIADPLVGYLALGSVAGNIVPAVDAWLEALVETGRWEEAVALAARIPLAKVPGSLFARIIDLEMMLGEEGLDQPAGRLRSAILAESGWPENHREEILRLADSERVGGRWAEAVDLYGAVEAEGGRLALKASLWGRYCTLEAADAVPEPVFLENIPVLFPGDSFFPLARLVRSRALERTGRFAEAMRSAAEGITFASVDEAWFPPLLLAVGRLYLETGDGAAADSAFRQTVFLFPDTPWSGRASDSLEQLNANHEEEPPSNP